MANVYPPNFESAFNHGLRVEGGYSKHENDLGGTTNWGITKNTYAAYVGKPASQVSDQEIKAMKPSFAKEIYYNVFWKEMNGDAIQNPRYSKLLFSQFINRGPRLFNDVKGELNLPPSAKMSDIVKALNAIPPEQADQFLRTRLENMRRYREDLIRRKPDQKVFARGWENRDNEDGIGVGIDPVPRYISSATIPGVQEEDLGESYTGHKAYEPDELIDIINQEYEVSSGGFLFNDQKLDIPPEQISILIDEYENSHLLIRTENPVVTQSGRKKIRIIVNFSVDVGSGWSKLAKIITQIRKTPIATIENEKVRKELFGYDDQNKYENIGVVVDNISGYVEDGFPTLIRCTLQMSWFNHAPYVESLRYKEKSDKENRVIYQNKPSTLYEKFYLEGTSNGKNTYNDPGVFLKNPDSLTIMFKEYAEFKNTFLIIENQGGSKLDKNKTMVDAEALEKRIELANQGWYFAEEDMEKLGDPIEGIWYRWRKIEIPFSDFADSSGVVLLQNMSFSLNTNPTYIPMEKYNIPTVQFMGGSMAELRAILFAAAEHQNEKDKTPIGTSKSLANLQQILRNVSEDRNRFSKFSKENHLLIMHPLAKLVSYGSNYDDANKLKYIESFENENVVSEFEVNNFLPVVLSSLESTTIPGSPFASNVQLDFKETRFGKKSKAIKYKGSVASSEPSNGFRAQENIIRKLYNKTGIEIDLNQTFKEMTGNAYKVQIKGVFKATKDDTAGLEFPYRSTQDVSKSDLLAEALTYARHIDPGIVDLNTAFSSKYFKATELPMSPNIRKNHSIGKVGNEKIWQKSFNANWIDQFMVSFYIDFIKALENGEEWVEDYVQDFEDYVRIKPKGFDDVYLDMKIPKDEINPAFYFADNLKRNTNFKLNIAENMRANYYDVEKNIAHKIFGDFYESFDGVQKTSIDSYHVAYNYAAKKGLTDSGTAKIHDHEKNPRVFSAQQAILNASTPISGIFNAYPGFRIQLFSNRYAYGQRESASDMTAEELREEKQLDLMDVFDLSSIIDIKIIKDQYEAADVMIIRILGTDKSLLTKQNKDPTYDPAVFSWKKLLDDIKSGKSTAIGSGNVNLSDVGLQEGTRIRCLLGNSAVIDELSIEFNGRIAAINGKDVIEVYCVGDGHELIQNTLGYPGESKDRKYTLNSETVDLVKEIIATSDEVKSFGNTKLQVFPNIKFNLPDFLGGRSAFDNVFAPSIHPSKNLKKFAAGAATTAVGIGTTLGGISYSLWPILLPVVAGVGLTVGKVALLVGAVAVAGAVLSEAYDSISKSLSPAKFVVYKQTIWDVLQELTLRHPGYVVAVVPFDRRSTIYFGEPDGVFFYRGVESALEKSLLISSMIQSGGMFKAGTIREVYDNVLNEKRENPNLTNQINSDSQFSIPSAKEQPNSREKNNAKKINFDSLAVLNMQKSFRNYHLVTSENDIISNDIEASSVGVANSVQVYYPKDDNEGNPDGTTWFSNYALTDYMKADDNLYSNLINNKVFTFHNAHNEYPEIELPQRYAKAILCKELENIYKGKIIILGRQNIKPHDIVILSDTHNRISGPIKVGRVIQSLSPEGGWTTTIYPKFIAIPDTSTGGMQMKAILKAARYWLGAHTDLFYSNMQKFTPDEDADSDKSMRELERAVETATRGPDFISEEELTEDFGKEYLDLGPESFFSLDQTEMAENAAFATGQYAGSKTAGLGRNFIKSNNKTAKGYGATARSVAQEQIGSIDYDNYKKNKNAINSKIYGRKSYKEIKGMFNQRNIKRALENAAQKKDIYSAVKVGTTAGKGAFRAVKLGGRLLFRTGIAFAGGFILEHYLSSAIDGLISYMKYRQPIYIFPLTKEGKPWMAALNGYKENSVIESVEYEAQMASDKLGMTAYIIETFFKKWSQGLPIEIGGVGIDISDKEVSVYDGDTFTLIDGTNSEKIRLKDVNTAEKFNQISAEKDPDYVAPGETELEMARLAEEFTRNQLQKAKKEGMVITLERHGKDSTSSQRTVGTIRINGISLRDMLIEKGLATPTVIKYENKLRPNERKDKNKIREVREKEWQKIKEIYKARQREQN